MEENVIGMPDSFFERLNKKNGFADDTTAAPVDSGTTPVATDKTIPSGMPDSFFEKLNSQQHYADTNNWAENYKRYIPQAEENPSAWDNIKNNFFAIKDASEASMYGGLELMSRQGEKSGNANFANFIKAAGMYYGADPNWLVKNMQENEAQSQEELKRVWLDPKMGQFNATDMFADPKSFFQTQLPQMLGGSATLMAAGMGIAKGVQTGVMALGAAGAPFTFGGSAVAAGFIGGAVASAISRPIESLMEGYGAFDEAYSELAKKYPNATHQQLTDMAMPVFNKTFDENMQLQVLDAVQLGLSIIPVTAWGKGSLSGTGAIGRMARRADMMRQRYNVAAHIGETAFQMGTEGWEEGRQMQITNEAINKYVGTDKPTSWYDMLNTKEGQSAVSGGAFMGGMMESPGILKLAYNKLTGVGDDIKTKPYEDIKQKQTALFYGNIAKSVNEGTTNEMMQAINKFGRSGVLATVETDDADSRNKSSIAEAKRLGDEVAEQVGVFSRMKEQYPDVSEKGLVRMFQNNALIRNNANALKTLSEDNVTDAPIIQRINAQNEALNKENNDIIAGKDVWETPSHEDPFADPEKDKEADIPFDSVEEVEAARLKEIEALQQIPTDGMTDEQMYQRAESLAEINSRYEDLKNRLTEKINDAKGHYENQRVLTEMLQNNIPVEGTIQKAYGMHYDFVTQDGKTVRFYNQATHDVVDDNDFNGSAFLVLRKAEQGLDGTYKDEKGNYLFRSVLGDKDHAERIEVHTTDKDGNDKYLGNVAVSNAEDYNIARDRAKAARMEKLEGEDGEGEGFSVSDEQLSGVKTTSNEQAAEAQSYGFRNAYHALNSVNKYFDADYTDYANIPKEDLALVGRIKQEEAASATTTTPPPDSPPDSPPPSEPDTPPAPPTPPPTPPPAPQSPSPASAPSGTTSSTDSGNAGYERTERSFDKVNVGDNITHNGKQGKVFAKVRPKGSLSHPVVLAKDAEGVVFRVSESEYKGTERGESDNVLKTNGKLLSYRNDIGRIVVDEENNVIFEGNKSSVELGKTTDEEFAAKSIGDIGISYVNENSLDQAILVDNTVYIKGEQQELVRINYDKNDNVVSYTYKNSKGHERTNRNSETALDIAIQKNNQEFDKSRKGVSDEVKQRDEEHISGVVKSEYGDSIGYILETMPDEVYDTFDLMESGVTSLEKDAIQYMVLRTIEALADARKRIEGSNATKKEKGSALSMIEKFEKDLNKYYGKLDQQGKVSAKDVAKANTRENNKGDGAVQDAEQKTEAYHADKAAGKETELVKAAEDLLAPKVAPTTNTEGETQTTESQLQEFGVPEQDVKPVTNVLTAMVDGLRKAGLTAAKTVGEWLQIGKGEEKPYTLKINGEEKTVKPVNAEVVNGFYSPLEMVITESKQDKMPAKQWLDKFAKGEEAKWTGLQEWLSQQQGSVSKADIQKFLKENRVQIVEVVKGEDLPNYYLDKEPPSELGATRVDLLGDLSRAGNLDNPRFRDYLNNKYGRKGNKIYDWLVENSKVQGKYSKDTKFSQYQLEGEKENYKEVLVTMPTTRSKIAQRRSELAAIDRERPLTENEQKEYNELQSKWRKDEGVFKSSHFDEPNILVHLRINTRTDAEGKKVLFIEEVQSDWGQKGKKEGFKSNERDSRVKELVNKRDDGTITEKERQELGNLISESYKAETPTAPFVTDTNAWTKLGLKVALKEAVAQGIDTISWTTGEQQNERYDLSKQVDDVWVSQKDEWWSQQDRNYIKGKDVEITLKGGGVNKFSVNENGEIVSGDFKGQELEAVIGKEMAEKILSATEETNFGEQDLRVGGSGMKGFYGSPTESKLGIVGNVAKKLFGQEPKTIDVFQSDKLASGWSVTTKDINGNVQTNMFDSKSKGLAWLSKQEELEVLSEDAEGKNYTTQHSITITPEMRAEVEGKGQPLFKEAEAQYHIESGKNIIEAIKDFDGSPRATVALTHEIMHPTVVAIIDGAKEGNEVGKKHTETIVSEFNKANPKNKVTVEDLIKSNDAFKDGTTSKQYRQVQEFIAKSWEQYHTEGGKGFSEAFQKVLDQITKAFQSVYKSITGKQLTPELRQMFDNILGKEELSTDETTPTKEVSTSENKIKSWIDKWEELKKENDNEQLDLFYNKVKVALNGYAQGKGVVDEFTKLKSEIEQFAKERKAKPKEQGNKERVPSNSNEGNSALRDVESTANALEDKMPFERKRQEAINLLPTEKINYKDIKGIGDLSIYLNNPEALKNSNLKSAYQIYEQLKNGDPIKDKPYLTDRNELLDGQNRIAAQLALGYENVDVVKVGKDFFVKPETKQISEAYHKAKADGSNPELVAAVEQLLGKPKETSPTPNSKGEGTEVKYQIEESRDEPLSSVTPALAEYIRQRMQRLFPSVALFSDKASFEAAAKKVSKGVTFSSAYIGAAIKNMVYVDAEKALQHTEIHEYAHIYWDALPADHPLKTALLDKFGGNEEAAIDAIGRAGTIIMENELDIAKSGFFEKWLKKFWAAVKGVFTSKSIEQAFAERLLTNADEVTEENITSGVVKYMKMKSSAKYSELSEKAVKGIEKIIGKKISSLTFPEYYKHISTEIKPNDFKQWKMLSPQKFLEKMYGIVSPVSTLSPSNKAVFMKQYREYLDDYNWAENNVWTRFASGSMTLTVKEIEDLYMEAYKRKSYGTKDAVNFLADLYSKAVMYKNMQQEIKGDTFNKPFAKMSFDMMSGHEITDLSGSEFVSGKYSLLSPDRVKETILQGREKLYREVQRNATIKEDALKNDFDAIWKKVKDLKSDLHKIVDKTGKYFIDRNSSAYKALRSGTVADRALADLLDMHYKYESAYGGLSMEKGKYRVPVARMDFGGLAKKFGFKEGMRRYFAKPSKYDNVIIDVRSLGLSKPLMTLKQARQEMVKGSNAIYPFQMLKLTKKVDALTKEAYKQFNSGRHANGDIVTTEDLSGSRYGVSFVKDDESSEDLKVSMMLYHYANIENESYDLLSPYSMYIQKYLGRKDKPNMLKWVKMLDDDLIKGESPTSNLGVYAKYVQALTNYTHWLQLGFNIAGMPFNAFAGFAQSVREIGFRNTLRGLRRVIGSLTVGGGAGVVNAKAISIMEKLHIVSLSKDLEMSVTSKIGKGISKIAFLPVSFVEYINHAYSFIGAMDESEWERVKALPANASAEDYTKAMGGNERVDELHTLTQKINGAYSKYSRRGINKTAEGRALMQFKNWLPDVIFAHLTVSQLNEAGEDLYGEYQSGIATSIKNTVWNKTIIPMFKDKSIAQAKKNWETLSEHEQMQVGKAMRQLVILGGMALWIASLDDRDDKELKRMLKRAMGDVTYIFDVSNMQFLFDNTVPVFGTIKNLLGLVAEVFSTATGNPSVYEKRQGSHMRGDLKLPVMIENQAPVVNKISKLVNEKD